MRCYVGLDDTDSKYGRCTTHLGFRLVKALLSAGCVFSRYPRLVRLNPNVPFKTRGNAAVCLEFETQRPADAFRTTDALLRRFSDVENGANSAAVFVSGDSHAELFRSVYRKAVSGMVSHKRVARALSETGIAYSTLGNGMGLVGAAASIGFSESDDHTYELIAYRHPCNCGTPRVLDARSAVRAEAVLFPHVFNNYDYGSRRLLVAPHGPDPVFLGIRADSPTSAVAAFEMVEFEERLEGWMVYSSNQCTDAHVDSPLSIPLVAYSSGWVEGSVVSLEEGVGTHLYITLDTRDGRVPCAVYRPACDLLRMARKLAAGDLVRVSGGVRRATRLHPAIVNVEKLEVLYAAPCRRLSNPACDRCGGSTKSEGSGKGFQCRRCGNRMRHASKTSETLARELSPGIYLPSPGSQRHLTKQLIRYGKENSVSSPLIDGWLASEDVRLLRVPARNPR